MSGRLAEHQKRLSSITRCPRRQNLRAASVQCQRHFRRRAGETPTRAAKSTSSAGEPRARARESGGRAVAARPRARRAPTARSRPPARCRAGEAGARGSIRDAASRSAKPSLAGEACASRWLRASAIHEAAPARSTALAPGRRDAGVGGWRSPMPVHGSLADAVLTARPPALGPDCAFAVGYQFPVGTMPAFSTMRITVRSTARVRCTTPLGITNPWRGPSSTVRSSRSIRSLPSTT